MIRQALPFCVVINLLLCVANALTGATWLATANLVTAGFCWFVYKETQ